MDQLVTFPSALPTHFRRLRLLSFSTTTTTSGDAICINRKYYLLLSRQMFGCSVKNANHALYDLNRAHAEDPSATKRLPHWICAVIVTLTFAYCALSSVPTATREKSRRAKSNYKTVRVNSKSWLGAIIRKTSCHKRPLLLNHQFVLAPCFSRDGEGFQRHQHSELTYKKSIIKRILVVSPN